MDRPDTQECRLAQSPSHPSRERGWTVVELMIAVAILASVTVGSTLILVPVSRQARLHRETEAADIAARSFLEDLRTLRRRAIVERYPPGSEVGVSGIPDGMMTLTYVDSSADPLEIRLRLQWTSPDLGPMEIELLTARTD